LKDQRLMGLDLLFIGLIGSKTKSVMLWHRLEEHGFSQDEWAQISCPIGLPGVAGKEPEVIVASVAVQLLHYRKA
jgi:xanthine dehydrogenase accessory factor